MKRRVDYRQWLRLQNYQQTSIKRLWSIQQKAEQYLIRSDLSTNQIGLQSFLAHCQTQGYSGAYIGQIQWAVMTYGQYLNKVRGQSIQLSLRKLSKNRRRRTALPAAAIEQLEAWLSLEQEDYWLKQSLWCLFYGAGLRRKEVLNLELQDFDSRRKLLEVSTSKTGKVRALPLSTRQTTALLSYLQQERPVAKEGYKNQLILGRTGGNAQSLLGIQLQLWQQGTGLGGALCWHVLRHTIATNLVERGMSIEQVSRFLGHKNIVSTSHYLHYLKKT